MRQFLIIIRDLLVLFACLEVGELIAHQLPFPFPGSIIGMLLLFVLLSLQLVKLHWVEAGAGLLLRHMSVLFIPVAVGVMAYSALLQQALIYIVLSALSGVVLILLVVGHLYQRLNQ
ncbi:CidA/LrgA family protein [Dongshaea marina]|uniref:CidA/LrgA family protein n=1 Tax=Dongshaea marina TaxID=2047966 RepID=UPI001F3EC271|nr:CidA/LrgA family protein [Dongshaea marina]